jgi:hypothetical protein
MIPNRRWFLLLACLALALGLAAACDESGDGEGGGDADSDSDSDGDTDTSTGPCSEVPWGGGFSIGSAVANWEQPGYIDGDLDGVVEEEEVTFTLEDIHCAGIESIVFVAGDTA